MAIAPIPMMALAYINGAKYNGMAWPDGHRYAVGNNSHETIMEFPWRCRGDINIFTFPAVRRDHGFCEPPPTRRVKYSIMDYFRLRFLGAATRATAL
jgi:hypothetical protein